MKKVAIVNRTNLKNYGSVLQVYALCETVRSLGYNPEVVWEKGNLSKNLDIRPSKILNVLLKMLTHPALLISTIKTILEIRRNNVPSTKTDKFDDFVSKSLDRKYYNYRELSKLANTDEYAKFICGSDQIWCSTALYVDPMMYLRFAPKSKRIAYAPSLGRTFIPKYNKRRMRRFISDFDYVSVREREGQELIYHLISKEVPLVLDPTLLISKTQWDSLKVQSQFSEYILCYFLDTPSTDFMEKLYDFAVCNGLTIVTLNNNLPETDKVKVLHYVAGIEEFLGLVDNSHLVVTDSYHGMLFSIIFQKKFWSVERNYAQFDQSSRQKTVLKLLGIENRYIKDYCDVDMSLIDYTRVNEILSSEREFSMDYLASSLDS